MRTTLVLLGTFLLVYFATPWVMHLLVTWLPFEHAERLENGVVILATIGVYALLRKRFGDKIPPV